jgi:hydroxypyruvate isomerase
MLRRDVLKLPAPLALGSGKPGGLKLSVRVEALFPGMPLDAAMEKVAEARYEGFEFGDWRAQDANRIVKLKNKLRLECVCLVGNVGVNPKGMGLCDPAEREGFLKEIRASVEAAKRFECSRLVVLSGFKAAGRTRAAQHESIVEGLKRAHDIVSPQGVTMIVEVVNTLAPVEPLNPKGNNHADYYLDRTDEAFAIAKKTGSPFVKILYDTYHTQIMEGNLIETIRKNIALIGHIHIGDVPQRHEPGTGEINFPNVFKAIKATGFEGYAAMEYVPSKDALTTLKETRLMVLGA